MSLYDPQKTSGDAQMYDPQRTSGDVQMYDPQRTSGAQARRLKQQAQRQLRQQQKVRQSTFGNLSSIAGPKQQSGIALKSDELFFCKNQPKNNCVVDKKGLFSIPLHKLEQLWDSVGGRKPNKESFERWKKKYRKAHGNLSKENIEKHAWEYWFCERLKYAATLQEKMFCKAVSEHYYKKLNLKKVKGITRETWLKIFDETKNDPVKFQKDVATKFRSFTFAAPGPMTNRCNTKPGLNKFLKQQDFFRHFFTPEYPRQGMLLWHAVGVGKTCLTVADVSENFETQGWKIIWVTRPSLKQVPLEAMFTDKCHYEVREAYKKKQSILLKAEERYKRSKKMRKAVTPRQRIQSRQVQQQIQSRQGQQQYRQIQSRQKSQSVAAHDPLKTEYLQAKKDFETFVQNLADSGKHKSNFMNYAALGWSGEKGPGKSNVGCAKNRRCIKDWRNFVWTYKEFTNICRPKGVGAESPAARLEAIGKDKRMPWKDDRLKKCLIVVDEAHNLYNKDLPADEQPDMKLVEQAIWHSYAKSGKDACRLLLLTATPSVPMNGDKNDPGSSILCLLNLLKKGRLISGRRDPLPKYIGRLPTTHSQFKKYYLKKGEQGKKNFMIDTRGLISYFEGNRQPDYFPIPKYTKPIEVALPPKAMEAVPCFFRNLEVKKGVECSKIRSIPPSEKSKTKKPTPRRTGRKPTPKKPTRKPTRKPTPRRTGR